MSKFDFSTALYRLKMGEIVTRECWQNSYARPVVKLQKPDKNSKMTEPYLYMEKFGSDGELKRFPLDLSCESILAKDWVIV